MGCCGGCEKEKKEQIEKDKDQVGQDADENIDDDVDME